MSKRPVMFVPTGFTIDENTLLEFEDCRVVHHVGWNMLHANVYKEHFQGNVNLEGWDIYTQAHPESFINKIKAYIK